MKHLLYQFLCLIGRHKPEVYSLQGYPDITGIVTYREWCPRCGRALHERAVVDYLEHDSREHDRAQYERETAAHYSR